MAVKDYGGKQPIISAVTSENSGGDFVVTITLSYAGRDGAVDLFYKADDGSTIKSATASSLSQSLTFTTSDITAGTTPSVSASVTTASGVASEIFTPVGVKFITTPGAPSGLSAAVADGSITVSWSAGDTGGDTNGNTVYRVEHSADGSVWTDAGTVAFGTNSKVISSLTNGTAYYYRVRTENSLYNSAYVQGGATATPLGTPSAPTVSASGTTTADPGTLTVSWSHVTALGGDDAANRTYDVQYSTDDSTWSTLSTGVTGTSATLSYDVPDDTSASQIYYFRARTNNSISSSGYSSSASARAFDEPGAPSTPSVSRSGSGSVSVSWTETTNYGGALSSSNISTEVYYSTDNSTWTYATATTGTSTTVSSLASNTLYYFRLRTKNTAQSLYSGYSASASVTVFGTPTVPASITYSHESTGDAGIDTIGETFSASSDFTVSDAQASSYGNKINVSWSSSDGAGDTSITYTLQASTNGGSTWSTVTTTSSTSYSHTGLTNSTNYRYQVRANNDVASSGYRTSSTDVEAVQVPNDITNVSASTTTTDGQITVTWTGGGFGGSDYAPNDFKIYTASTPLSGSTSFTLAAIVPNSLNSTSATITGLANQEYFISVNSWNGFYERSGAGTTITPFFPPYFPPFFPPYFPPFFPPFFPPYFPPYFPPFFPPFFPPGFK